MSDREQPEGPNSDSAHERVTPYSAGEVPGVEYRDGVAHSPTDPSSEEQPPEPPQPEAPQAGQAVTPPAAEPVRRRSQAYPPPPPAPAPASSSSEQPPGSGTRIMPSADSSSSPPPSARPERQRRRRPRRRGRARWVRWILIVLLILLLALVGLFAYAWSSIEKVDAVPDDHGEAVSDGQVFLLVGSDSREGLSDEEISEFGTGEAGGRRADTIMLLHRPRSGSPALVSVPRDSLVDIPGHGEDRINAAYASGGAPLLAETIEANTGVAVDEYVEIGFGGFVSIVDAMGGVEVCLDDPIEDSRAHIDLPAGCQELAGPEALGLARSRYADPRADLGRVENQRMLMGAIADEATSLTTLLNPVAMTRLALSGGDAVALDESTGPLDVFRFAAGMRGASGGSGATLTVPVESEGPAVRWTDEADELWESLRGGVGVPDSLLDE